MSSGGDRKRGLRPKSGINRIETNYEDLSNARMSCWSFLGRGDPPRAGLQVPDRVWAQAQEPDWECESVQESEEEAQLALVEVRRAEIAGRQVPLEFVLVD